MAKTHLEFTAYEEPLDEFFVPDIDSGIPLPMEGVDAFPKLTPGEEVEMRAATIKLLADLTHTPIEPTTEDQHQASILARKMVEDNKLRPEFAKYKNETIAFLAGMVAQYNCAIVDDLAELKQYIINKLVYVAEHPASQKEQLNALRALGDIDGVDAFKRRTETTVIVKPLEEVEKDLKTILESLDHIVVSETVTPLLAIEHSTP